MNLSRERVERWSTETGFRVETLEKVLRLGELAADISRHPLLGHVLALKGGTALNRLLKNPLRAQAFRLVRNRGALLKAGLGPVEKGQR